MTAAFLREGCRFLLRIATKSFIFAHCRPFCGKTQGQRTLAVEFF
jgi:hypothetical protein